MKYPPKNNSFCTLTGACLIATLGGAGHAQMTVAPVPLAAISAKTSNTLVKDTDSIVEPFGVRDESDFFGLLDLSRADLGEVRAAVALKDWQKAKAAWAKHLETRTNAQWFWAARDREAIKRVLDERGQSLTRMVPSADKVMARQFTFVGIPKTLDQSPQWEQGVNEWTSVLNRFHYFNELGRAYWATGDKKYAQDYVLLLQDWIAKNPVPKDISTFGQLGRPWRALENGLRTQSWLDGMHYFMEAPEFNPEVKYQMTRSFVEHARYLRAVTIGKGYRPGNWQMIEATSLAALGMMFPEFRESQSWRARGFQTLAEQMARDVYPDGAMSELAPGYHMAVTEQFMKVALLAQKNGYQVPGLLDRHEKMFEFIMHLSQPDRIATPVADAGKQPVAPWMADGALLYNRADFRFLAGDTAPAKWVWTFGPSAFERFAKMVPQRPAFTSHLLPDAKYGMMRTGWEASDKYMLFDMAPWGGGHSHQDRLQVTAYAERDLLIDPGQYGYDEPLSKYFRSSAAHNVIMVDGKEQPNVNPKVLAWETTSLADFASGSIEDKTLKHQRSVLFLKPHYWVVVDHLQAPDANEQDANEHDVVRFFHLAPTTTQVQGNRVRSTFPKGTNIELQTGDGATLEMQTGWVPVNPAKAQETPVAAFTTRSKLPLTLSTVLTPLVGAQGATVKSLPSTNPRIAHLSVTFPNGQQDEILISDEPRELQIGAVKGKGRALYVRRGPDANTNAVIGGQPQVTARK